METEILGIWLEDVAVGEQSDGGSRKKFVDIDTALAFAKRHQEAGYDLVLTYPPSGRLRVPLFHQ